MTERLLQYIWQFKYFNTQALQTEAGGILQIIYPGQYNTNQGPDFLNANIKIDNTIWAGNIEIHLYTSDWKKHKHENDVNYKNVILHVVWQNDVQEALPQIPLLVLQHRIAKPFIHQYQQWMQQQAFIPCANTIHTVKEVVWITWKERLLVERLYRKSQYVLQVLQRNNNHWEETFWQLLAKNFGIKINAEAFESIAKSISINIIAKHKNQITTLEALLLGQAGLLENTFSDEYAILLQREYRFHQHKYKLPKVNEQVHFLRMRPAAFPTVRLAQLAMLLYTAVHLFSKMKEIATAKEAGKLLNVTANDFWHTHYTLHEASVYKEKNIGKEMVNNIIINTVVPILFAYGLYNNEQVIKDKALKWMEEISAENNAITKQWQKIAIVNKHAYDSQSLIELKTNYCDKKKCLDCSIGNAILKKSV